MDTAYVRLQDEQPRPRSLIFRFSVSLTCHGDLRQRIPQIFKVSTSYRHFMIGFKLFGKKLIHMFENIFRFLTEQ